MTKVYLQNVVDSLGYLASCEFQKIAWFENDQGLCSSFSDDVSAVFEGTGLEYALDIGKTVFGKETDDLLRDLNDAVEAIGYKRENYELIDSPEMQTVREKAKQILALIQSTGKQYEFVVEI